MSPNLSIENKRILRNSFFLYLRMILTLFINLYITRVLLNMLGANDFGIYNVVCGFVSMLGFLNTSMSHAIQRFYNFEIGKNGSGGISQLYTSALLTQFILALFFLVSLETFGLWYLNNKLVIPEERNFAAFCVFQFSVFSMFFSVLQVPYTAFILANERMNFYSYIGLLDVFLRLIIVILLQFSGFDKLILYGALLLIVNFLILSIYFVFVQSRFDCIKVCFPINFSIVKSIMTFSGWNMYETGAYMVNNQGINIILNLFFGPSINAARGIAFQVSNALRQFCLNVMIAVKPQITQSYAKGEYSRTKSLFYYLTIFSFVIMYMLSVPIIIEIDFILKFWIGGTLPDYTASFSILVIINSLINLFNTPMSQVIHATGKIKKFQIVAGSIVLLNLPISFMELKYGFRPEYVFITSIILSFLTQIPSLFLLKKEFPFSINEYFHSCIIKIIPFVVFVPILPMFVKYSLQPSFVRIFIVFGSVLIVSLVLTYYTIIDKNYRLMLKQNVMKTMRSYIKND